MHQLDFAVYISYMVSTKEIHVPVLLTSLTKHIQASHPAMYSTLIMYLLSLMQLIITRNFGRSLRIPDASMQTSVNFPRTRPLTCMEQSAFLFSINQESSEKRKAVKNIVKNIFHYALLMKQKNSGSICRFHGPKTTRP